VPSTFFVEAAKAAEATSSPRRALRAEPPWLPACPRTRELKSNVAIAIALHLSESSVEKYVNTIFSKLGLSEERSVSRRVTAVLTYLHDANGPMTT